VPGLSEAFERVGEAVEHHLPQTHAAGLALGVTDAEELLGVVVRGFADAAAQVPVRPETRFQIGSISKQFAAIMCLQEVESGRLDLHAPVIDILAWLELPQPFGPITMHHLLTHTSGLATGTEEAPMGTSAAWNLRHVPPTFAPGERFWYSNDGYKLVGLVLERICGMPFHELLQERILGPLGMRASDAAITPATRPTTAVGYEPILHDRPPHLQHPLGPATWIASNTADGSIVSTVVDMANYARMLLGRGRTLVDGHDVRILSDAMFDQLIEPRTSTDDPEVSYAYGLDVFGRDGRRHIGHSGGMVGFTALLEVDVDAGVAATILQNGGGDKKPLMRYALTATRAAVAGAPVEPAAHPDAPTRIDAPELVGVYHGDRRIELEATADGLRLKDGPLGVPLERWPGRDVADAFLVPHPAWDRYLLRALRNEAGTVTELVHGPRRFRRDHADEDEPEAPPAWSAFPGLYRSNNLWSPVLRVFVRAGRLWLLWPSNGVEEELVPLGDGSFAVGETWKPERIRFDREVEGLATLVEFNAGRWYRSFEE
jgi:D-alanyl-D-alanine carboxypeptidase